MATQQTFDVAMRERDLPPLWDGLVVVWDGWHDQLPVLICPPPRARTVCSSCGSTSPAIVNRGRVARSTVVTREDVDANEAARARLPQGQRHRIKPKAWIRLYAHRCIDCRHDVVLDMETGEQWDLDITDYGDSGSTEPAGGS